MCLVFFLYLTNYSLLIFKLLLTLIFLVMFDYLSYLIFLNCHNCITICIITKEKLRHEL
jgi:hypothetical protein